ncbi:MAG: hypothetical protein NXI10_03850 [bacterium]|nr:hypothetical protein [bacterium]
MSRSIFSGRRLCIATKHGKEAVIGPIMESALEVEWLIPNDFDTDTLGTFTGEVERKGSPIDAAREKCIRAMEVTGCDLVVASEGSFGNHPALFFVPADEEFLFLFDAKNNLEIVARHISTETNFGGEIIDDTVSLMLFAEKAKFPEHALIIKNSEKDWVYIKKGIQNEKELRSAFDECMRLHQSVFVETDMRAMLNPSRMKVIEKATEKLIEKVHSECPNCKMPGFDVVTHQPGLPCANCSLPTRSTLQDVYCCTHCQFEQIEKFPRGKEQEDPMYCDFCNP